MKIIKGMSFYSLFFVFLAGISLAQTESPGIKITEPLDGTTVTPGQEITVTVEAVGGFELVSGLLGISTFILEDLTALPSTFTLTIPMEAIGKITIDVIGKNRAGSYVEDEITLYVQQTATLQSLEIDQDTIYVDLDWGGNIKEWSSGSIVTTYGLFSDGIKREIPRGELTYTSTDSSVISIDNKGNYQVHKVGEAAISVFYSGVSKTIPVVFKKPTGIKPLETIPPTTQIDIQPPANLAGWNNTDITITITAKDNEGGSGIAEINYQWYNMSAELEYVQSDTAVLYLSKEGRNHLMYFAVDKERNEEKERHDVEFKLDKTPPSITQTTTPGPNPAGWHNTDATISFTAQDSLSGIKSVTQPITLTTEGQNQTITGEAIDNADNKTQTSVSINLDKTPPAILLELQPINLSNREKDKKKPKQDNEGNWYELSYSATDPLSGLKSLTAGLIIPSLANYKVELQQDNQLTITIDEQDKELEIEAQNPQELLTQLQSGLFTLNNNQTLQLKLKQGEPKWKLKDKDNKGLEIQSPSIIFKAFASDIADNTATKELHFKKDNDDREND